MLANKIRSFVDGTHAFIHSIRPGRRKPSWSDETAAQAGPDFSLCVIIGGGAYADIEATLKSVVSQRRAVFEVIVSLPESCSKVEALRLSQDRPHAPIKVLTAPDQSALRTACEATTHDFILLLAAGDVLVENSLQILSDHIRYRMSDMTYSDEAWVGSRSSGMRFLFKPGWSPELLTSYDYFGPATVINRKAALDALPQRGDEEPVDGWLAATWDLKLRVSEQTRSIERIATIVCHQKNPGEAGIRGLLASRANTHAPVLASYWKRQGIDAQIHSADDGSLHATWALTDKPLVSVIIPNKNRAQLLRTCVDGLYTKTDYTIFELIIVDNGSTEPETLALYAEIEGKSGRIVRFDEEFNYSRACNLGASHAKGDLLLFLNNDIEMIERGWLDELVRHVLLPGVGIVGPKLTYPDGRIQHAGVAIGLFTLAAHVFHEAPHNVWGPFGSPDTKRNWMAVTGACHLVRRAVFDLVNGYDEDYLISYSDVVFCLDARALGFRTVYVPSARLNHHEGASRGHTNPSNDQALFARRLRALGIGEDPYFHPALSTQSFIPVLRDGGALPADAKPMQEDIELIGGDAMASGLLDIHDDGAVAYAVDWDWASITTPFNSLNMTPGLETAAWILISFARRRRDLRVRFPTALSDGANGGFATWVKTVGLKLLGLGADHAPWIDAAFAGKFGAKTRQCLIYNDALRRQVPLFLLPNGRVDVCKFLFANAETYALSRVDIWWFLVECAEDPQRELLTTWAITPLWQEKVPDGGTALGMVRLIRWISATYAVTQDWIFEQRHPEIANAADQVRIAYAANPDWRATFPDALKTTAGAQALLKHLSTRDAGLPFLGRAWVARQNITTLAEDIVRPGLNILGHFSYPSGLRISTESIVAGLYANDVDVSLRDVPVNVATDEPIGHRFSGCEIHDITLIHVQPEPLFDVAYERAGLHPRSERTYRIGYWYWEFDNIPTSWDRAALDCDELWTATEFIAGGLRERYRQPVKVFLPGIEIAPFERRPRSYFELDDEQFIFLFVFHMTSVMERKNPFGLIRAFKDAFQPEDNAKLVIKTSFGAQHPEQYAQLKDAADGANIALVDKSFSRDDTLSLISACDAYVSLHRSEGLGLSMAEAMLLGRPVVATRYSGNLEFMDDDNSLLVDHKLVTLNRDVPPYKAGQHWAEPSVAQAAAHMRRLHDDPVFARDLGARAKADLERRLNYRTTGAAISARLRDIAAMP